MWNWGVWTACGYVDNAVRQASRAMAQARDVVVVTGAGMSRESGIPTFREAHTGLWAQYDATALATQEAFRAHPARVFGWYVWRRSIVARAHPHAGHRALAALEARLPGLTVVTQNVDGLHRRAGSHSILELHGTLDRFSCVDARHPFPSERVPLVAEPGELDPPRCPMCGAFIRPDVVWFGEALPERVLAAAWEAAAACDVMLVVGTSGIVHPAGYLPIIARDGGAMVIEINPDTTAVTPVATAVCRGAAGDVLPALLEAMAIS